MYLLCVCVIVVVVGRYLISIQQSSSRGTYLLKNKRTRRGVKSTLPMPSAAVVKAALQTKHISKKCNTSLIPHTNIDLGAS